MRITRNILGSLGLKQNSIGFEALIATAWRVILLIGVLSVGSYFLVQQQLETRLINKLEIAVEARAHREGELFRNIEQANENAKRILQSLLENDTATNTMIFEDVFIDFGDNTYRTIDEIYDGTLLENGLYIQGSAGFIPNAADYTTADKKLMAAAIQTVVQVGSAYYPQFESYYFYTPQGRLFIWAPDRAGNLMFYRKEAPPDFSITDYEVVQITLPENNPERAFVCTTLQPIVDASTGASWTRGCQIPFDFEGKHVGGFGSSMRLTRTLGDGENNPLVGGEHMIISADGKLVEHPKLTKPGTDIEKNLDILSSENEDIKTIYSNVQLNGSKITWVDFVDKTNSYIAASEIYGLGGYYVIAYPKSLIAAEASATAFNILYLGLAAMVIALFTLAATMKRTVTQPLNQLVLRTKQLALGKFEIDKSTRENGPTAEIEALAASTEQMASELSQIVFNLEKTVDDRTKDLKHARDEAEKANSAKTDFLANMSHEIRTPLTGVIGMLELLAEEQLTPSAKTYLDMAQKSSTLLLNLVNDILDISRLEAGKFSVRLSTIELTSAIKETSESLALLAKQKQLSLTLEDNIGSDFWVLTDIKIIRQILINLIGNAIKFTDTGGVTVAVSAYSMDDNVKRIAITVSDSGKGLTTGQIEKLFERFEQVETEHKEGTKGTGLGLAIVKELTALLGGDINCTSEPDAGTSFHVTIPMKSSTEPKSKSPDEIPHQKGAKPLLGVTLLGVDDNPINRVIVQRVCEQMGAKITMLESGADMVAELGTGTAADKYDALLMDINMPGLNGIETLAAIRALPGKAQTIPAIALTADAIEGTAQRMKEGGMAEYVTKPIDPKVLATAILDVIKPTSQNGQ